MLIFFFRYISWIVPFENNANFYLSNNLADANKQIDGEWIVTARATAIWWGSQA